MRVIEQLEGVFLNASVWESTVFPARVREYQPSMLDELISSSDVVWVGSKASGSNAKEAGDIAFYPAGSLLLNPSEPTLEELKNNETLTMPEAVLAALSGGGAFPIQQLSAAVKTIWQQHAEVQVNPETGEIIFPAWVSNSSRKPMVTGMARKSDERLVHASANAPTRRQNCSHTSSCRT